MISRPPRGRAAPCTPPARPLSPGVNGAGYISRRMEYSRRPNSPQPVNFSVFSAHAMSESAPARPERPVTELALEQLLPQRRPMLLLDRVLSADEKQAVTESLVRRDWPLAGENGVAALVLIEIAAQTAGVSCSCERIRKKGLDSEQTGWIVAIKRAELRVAELLLGARIRAEAENTIN